MRKYPPHRLAPCITVLVGKAVPQSGSPAKYLRLFLNIPYFFSALQVPIELRDLTFIYHQFMDILRGVWLKSIAKLKGGLPPVVHLAAWHHLIKFSFSCYSLKTTDGTTVVCRTQIPASAALWQEDNAATLNCCKPEFITERSRPQPSGNYGMFSINKAGAPTQMYTQTCGKWRIISRIPLIIN